jgi:hypothetical protein
MLVGPQRAAAHGAWLFPRRRQRFDVETGRVDRIRRRPTPPGRARGVVRGASWTVGFLDGMT